MSVFTKIEFANFENKVRFIYDDINRCLVTLGPKSYIVDATVEAPEKCNILIGSYCSIAHDVRFLIGMNHEISTITTYPETLIGCCDSNNSVICQEKEHKKQFKNINDYQISIGHDVWIGRGATILSGVKIGNGAIIGAQSVVAKDVPPYAIVVGNPGRVVKYRFDETIIKKLQAIKWWYWTEERIVANKELLRDTMAFTDKFYQQQEKKKINTATSIYLSKLRRTGIKIYYFIPDFSFRNCIWKNVIKEYLSRYTAEDQVMLVLEINEEDKYKREMDWIYDEIKHRGDNAPQIIKNNNSEEEISLDILQNTDAFITTCSYESVQCIDYLSDYNASILTGVNDKIFS